MTPRRLALTGYLLLLAFLTLWPSDPGAVVEPGLCLLCGDRGLADAILNVLLFLPLGLALSRRGWLLAIVAGLAVSAGIEALQLVIPGRYSTPSDVLFNTLGAAAGAGLGQIARYWVHPSSYLGDRLATVAAILVAATLPLTAWLSEQELPEPPYFVEWETSRPGVVPYPGTVLMGAVQPLSLTPGPSARGVAVKRLLEEGSLMGVFVAAGAPPEQLAPLLALYDAGGGLVALLGVDGTDLVYRERTRASRLRLDNPDRRATNALDSVAAGDTLQLATAESRGKRCFLVRKEMTCGYGIAGNRGWRFLYALNGARPEVHTAVSALWLLLLLVPVGYWARWHLALGLAAAIAGYAWIAAPAEVGLLPVPPVELAGVAVGVVLGMLARRAVRRALPTGPPGRRSAEA